MTTRNPLVLVSGQQCELASGDTLPAAAIPAVVAGETHAATEKTTPADADEMGLSDSAASWGLKKFTWASIKSALANVFLPLQSTTTAKTLTTTQNAGFALTIAPNGFPVTPESRESTLSLQTHAYSEGAGQYNYSSVYSASGITVAGSYFWIRQLGVWGIYLDSGIRFQAPNGIGYSTSSRGTVTQSTNHSTAVTLNTPCGTITMASASLAGNAIVTFTLNNSVIAATDVIVFSCVGASPMVAAPIIATKSVAAGSCTISVRNGDATARTCAPVINFMVLKGSD